MHLSDLAGGAGIDEERVQPLEVGFLASRSTWEVSVWACRPSLVSWLWRPVWVPRDIREIQSP